MEYQHPLIKLLFKTPTIVEDIPMSYIDILCPEFDSAVDKIYSTYSDVEIYDVFILEHHDNIYDGQIGFDMFDDNGETLYGTINFSLDENFKLKEIDWYID